MPILIVGLALLVLPACGDSANDDVDSVSKRLTIYPEEYPHALRNPLKGFRPYSNTNLFNHRFISVIKDYIRWNDLDRSASDDLVGRIINYSGRKWARPTALGIKVIPRVYLDWDGDPGNEYWPSDMETGDYSSPQFKKRVTRLVKAMAECWDNDPRVAWIHMGIIGRWGEHHSPHADLEMQQFLGGLFTREFKNKRVLVRHPDEFLDFEFGIYWDSWAHARQTTQLQHGAGIEKLNQETARWKTHPIEGEIAYNWGDYKIQPGDDPDDTLSDPVHRDFLIDTVRNLHGTALGWISRYDQTDPDVIEGAEIVQKVFGYRFTLESFSYTPELERGGEFAVEFKVKNTGSAPFYNDWPVYINFLDPETKAVVWRQSLEDVAISQWMPGEDWDAVADIYQIPAETYTVASKFALPDSAELPAGEYVVALSIPDPGSDVLGLRLATTHYYKGDFHPMGKVALSVDPPKSFELDPQTFADPMQAQNDRVYKGKN